MRGPGPAWVLVVLFACGDDASRHVGRVLLGTGPAGTSAFAQFDLCSQAFADRGCTRVAADEACAVENCVLPWPGVDCRQEVGAGDIAIQYGSTTLALDPLAPPSDFFYPGVDGVPSAVGDTIEVTAAGSPHGAPPFHGTLVTPSRDVAPTLDNIAVNRANPLVVRWTGAAIGTVTATLDTAHGDRGVKVSCSAPGANGLMTIPATMLGKLDVGPVSLTLSNTTSVQLAAGDYDVTVSATPGNDRTIPGTVD